MKINFKLITLLIILSVFINIDKTFSGPLVWKKVKAVAFEVKKLPEGKTLSCFTSPDKHFQLIEILERSGSIDNHALYFKNAHSYKLIDKYQQIKRVKWSDDSSKVYLEAIKNINYDEISYWKISYIPNLNTVFAQVLQMKQ